MIAMQPTVRRAMTPTKEKMLSTKRKELSVFTRDTTLNPFIKSNTRMSRKLTKKVFRLLFIKFIIRKMQTITCKVPRKLNISITV